MLREREFYGDEATRPLRVGTGVWLTWLPLALVLFSLLSLLAVPRIIGGRIEARRRVIVGAVVPARSLLSQIQLDLATQIAAARGYLLTRDPRFRRDFEIASEHEQERFDRLRPLAQAIGPDVLEIATRLHQAKVAWTDVVPGERGGTSPGEGRQTLQDHAQFQDVIHLTSQLDAALSRREAEERERVQRLIVLQDVLVSGLGLLALLSAAGVAWLTARSRRLRAVLRRRVQQERALRELARSLSGALTVDAVAHQVVRHATESTRAAGGYVERVMHDGQVRVVAATGTGAPDRGTVVAYPGSLTEAVVEAGEPVVVDLHGVGGAIAERLARSCAGCSALLVPLFDEEEVLGALVLLRRPGQPAFDRDDVLQARALGDLASAALRRVVLGEERDRQRRAAENAVRARDEVLAIVSHDLRNPLNAIVVGAQALLTMEVSREQQAPMLEIIRRNAARMDRLIRDLLDASRLEGGRRLSVEPAPLPLAPVAEEVCQAVAVRTQSTLQSVACEVPRDLPPVLADRDRLLQVLGNLLDNALKFTPEGGRITIRARQQEGQVRIEVSDTGPGIPEQHLAHLFEPFYQARQAGRHSAGLGLAIAKGIVEAHGGRIGVDTAEGRGSTFWFTLPLSPTVPPPEREPVAAAAGDKA